MNRKKLKRELSKIGYWKEVLVNEVSLDQPIAGDSDDDSLSLLDVLGAEDNFIEELDAAQTRQIIIFSLPEIEQVQVLVLKQMGYRYWEIKRILHLRSLSHYYQIFNRLKRNYRKAMKKLSQISV